MAWLRGFALALGLIGLGGVVRASDAPTPPIAVVVAARPAAPLRPADLELIYLRKRQFWAGGGRIVPVNLPAGHPLRAEFSRLVLGRSPDELERYWDDAYFHGVSPPFVLASPEAVLRFVAATPGAIGYLSYCEVDTRVHVALVLGESGPIDEDAARRACRH